MAIHVIAEAGVNHNGDIDSAYQLIDAAATAGADSVKFQMFESGALVTKTGPKAPYQKATTSAHESQIAMLRSLELEPGQFANLASHARSRGLEFLCTPFDENSLNYLTDKVRVTTLKVGSGDLTNGPLLLAVARKRRKVILSSGMSTLEEITQALAVLAHGFAGRDGSPALAQLDSLSSSDVELLANRVTLLQCTTAYPAPFEDINLSAIGTLKHVFGLPVGLSDHSLGTAVPIAAVAFGAVVLEKHLTLSRKMSGPDHAASLEPDELARLVTDLRQVEKAIGNGIKRPTLSELENVKVARRSVVATRSIERGEQFTEDNISVKRPGGGLSPMAYWECLTKVASRDFAADELIELD